MILGLDCSTSVCGWTILKDDGSFGDIGYIDFKKLEDLYEKVDKFRDITIKIDQEYRFKEPIKIFIEEPLMAFTSGGSMALTLSKLQRFNGMVSITIYDDLHVKPILINASHARKLCGIKTIRGQNTKEIVLDFIQKLNVIPVEKWEKKKTGKYKDTCFDMADSYVVALAGLKENG